MRTVHSGVWWPEDRAQSRYRYLPVDVPSGAGELRVTLSYDTTAGVLDLGCFGPAGEFRGYSGGARHTFAVSAAAATPGYRHGPVDPGTWQVLLGLHRVPPTGLRWTVAAESTRPTPPPPSTVVPTPAARSGTPKPVDRGHLLPAPAGCTWIAGDLHAHTLHSDGALTVAELATLAADAGLDFLAVTDHNTDSHHGELSQAGAAAGILLVPGQEVTTDRGHANAFGSIGWVDFRLPADDWMSTVDGRGGLLSINHPLGGDMAWLHPLRVRPRLAEVWHSGWWDRTWGAPLAWLLAWGPGTVPIGGSDFHDLDQAPRPGRPTTWVAVEDVSVAGVLAGLRAGRTAIGATPRGPVLLRVDDSVVALGADGTLLVDVTGRRRPVRGSPARFPAALPARDGPHWLEDDRAQILAICA
jgi:hypothetical protein